MSAYSPNSVSVEQERYGVIEQATPGNPASVCLLAVRIEGPLDVPRLLLCLNEVVRRHSALRARFLFAGERRVRSTLPWLPREFAVSDINMEGTADWQAEVQKRAVEESQRRFNLTSGPLVRATLLRFGPEANVLLLSAHAAVFDDASAAIVLREVATLYENFSAGRPSPLPEPALQIVDFARWQRQWLQNVGLASHLPFWKEQLEGELPVLELSTDHPRPPERGFRGASATSELPAKIAAGVEELGGRERASARVVLLAAWSALLHRYTGQEDILMGTPVSGRSHPESRDLVGRFAFPIVVRARLSGAMRFSDLVRRVEETMSAAEAHSDLPFATVLEHLNVPFDSSRHALFQASFELRRAPAEAIWAAGVTLSVLPLERPGTEVDLALSITPRGPGLIASITYASDLFEPASIERMLGHYRTLLESAIAHPDQPIGSLPILSDAERRRLLVEWNDTQSSYPSDTSIHELFEAQVERAPDALAVAFEHQRLSYGELNRRANQVAHHLRSAGVDPGSIVGLCFDRSPEMIVGLLGILKAGAAFLPLDPTYPKDRLSFMVQDSRAPVIVTQQRLVERLGSHASRVLCLDKLKDAIAREREENPVSGAGPRNLAYVIYTSGSTGTPKGTLLEHQGLCNLAEAQMSIFGVGPGSRVLQFARFSFDASVWETFMALRSGAALWLASQIALLPGPNLALLLRDQGITTVTISPSALASLPVESLPALRTIIVAGETCPAELVNRWAPGRRFFNAYGPTEATVCATVAECYAGAGRPPIGRPLPNVQVYVLDRCHNPAPIGVPGELYIGGAGLARGYLNRPELTEERFIPDPFSKEPGARLYKTGDIAKWLPDGDIDFLGRVDQQVKVRGFRIELAEIETVLGRHPDLKEAIVIVREDTPGDKRIVAYMAPHEGKRPQVSALRGFLGEKLPAFMIPSAFVVLGEMPLTPSGKVDRKALPPPGSDALEGRTARFDLRDVEEMLARHPDVLDAVVLREGSLSSQSIVAYYVKRAQRGASAHELRTYLREKLPENILPAAFVRLVSEQDRACALEQMAPGSPACMRVAAVWVDGALDVKVLKRSLNEIVLRHGALRTSFPVLDGRISPRVDPVLTIELNMLDFSLLPESEWEEESLRQASEELQRPFDFGTAPLVRTTLLRFSRNVHALILTAHSAVFDAGSVSVLLRELGVIYNSFESDKPSPLAAPPLHDGDTARWQRQWLQRAELFAQLSYWKEQLAGELPSLAIYTDRPRPAVRSYQSAAVSRELAPALLLALEELADREGVSLFVVLLAAFNVLLHRYTEQDDILVGTPTAGIGSPADRDVIGRFDHALVIRSRLSGDLRFQELLKRVAATATAAEANRDLPFAMLLEELKPPVDESRHPIFQAAFELYAPTAAIRLAGLAFLPLEIERAGTEVDLSLSVMPASGSHRATMLYNADIFDASTIERLLGHFVTLLSGIVAQPDKPIASLPMLTPEERRHLVTAWNDTRTDYPRDATIHALFEAQVERSPAAVAAVFDGHELTYQELNLRANRLAHRLREQGVGLDVPVGIFVERSLDMLVGLLGILKAGGAYVPLDPDYPAERLSFMLEETRAPVLVARPVEAAKLSFAGRLVDLTSEGEGPSDNPASGAGAESLAYITFTSGSTGRPKGVAVVHRGVVRLVARATYVRFRASDRIMHASNLAFDASTFEIWGALLNGARVVVLSQEVLLSPKNLSSRIRQEGITIMWLTAALFHQMAGVIPEAFRGLRYLLAGGDALDPKWVREILEKGAPESFVNGYGPTENTTFSTTHLVREVPEGASSIPIGRPISNSQAYVLDRELAPVPIGVVGELYVGGDGLARGYINRPELTTERFLPNPFSDEPEARIYKTGDRARYLPDGTIEFLGRADHQVKIRGFRVELGEIEAVLGANPAVREVVVMLREDTGDKRLVAYVSSSGRARLSSAELRAYLQDKLPGHMIPAAFVVLERLPLTPNGKVDRKALPPPALERVESVSEGFVAPRNPIEDVLAGLWVEALKVDRVGVHDNFLALGGHSLLAIQIISRAREIYGIDLPLRAIFEAPTVAGLARVMEATRGQELKVPLIKRISRDKPLPLSYAQQQLWLLVQVEPSSPFYNETVSVRMRGPIDPGIVEKTLQEIIRRHEILRTSFSGAKGSPVQTVAPSVAFTLPVTDLSHLPEPEREPCALRLSAEAAKQPFNLGQAPLIRASLVKVGEEDHWLFLTLHHIIVDGVSFHSVLFKELSTIYRAFAACRSPTLPVLSVQYADFAFWQRKTHTVEALDAQIRYWEHKLADLSMLELPMDRGRPAVQRFQGAKHNLHLPKSLVDELKEQSRKEGVTFFMLLLAAWKTLLHRYSGQDDILVGTAAARRDRPELEPLLGFFVNPLVLRTDLSGDPTFRELLARVREMTLDAYSHQEVPFEMLVEVLRVPRTRSHNPIFQVVFVLEPPMPDIEPNWTMSQHDVDTGTAKFDLTLYIDERSDGAVARFEYDSDLWHALTIERMASHFRRLLESTIGGSELRLSELPFVSAEEERQSLAWSSGGEGVAEGAPGAPGEVSEACLHELFEVQAARRPDAIAVIFEDERLTYAELDRQSTKLANHLRRLGVGPETLVGLFLERSKEVLVGILGVLKAGGAYVPLSPDDPVARTALVLQETMTPVVVTQRRLLDRLPGRDAKIICLDTDHDVIERESDVRLATGVTPSSLAYVMYTVGSTGKPRGVMISHANVLHLLRVTAGAFRFTEDDVWTMFHAFAFGFSVWEMWGALFHGGKLVVVPQSATVSPEAFYELLCAHRVTVLNQIPSAFRHLSQVEDSSGGHLGKLSLRLVCLGGEALDFRTLRPWFERHGDETPAVYNLYGLTGATVFVTYRRVTAADARENAGSRIGRPIPGTEVYILDRRLQAVPAGVGGEIYVGGPGLTRGYYNRPDVAAERFVRHPFNDEPGACLYKTGDRARFLPGGDIEFLGRVDQQIKLRGFRIEPREVEVALAQHPDVREAVVIVREDTPGDQRLVAYYVKRTSRVPTTNELRTFLKEMLPDYMVPTIFVVVPVIPVVANGKVNRRSLPPPDRNRPSLMPIFRLPSNPAEVLLLGIWTGVLQVDQIGVKDDFFSLGGHSLLAAQMIARVRERFRIDLRHSSFLMREFLENPTIVGLAEAIETVREATPSARGRLVASIDFNAEVTLDTSIRFDAPPVERWNDPSAVLLTGVTGFLGAYMLEALIKQTRADIYCHVRAPDVESARQKIVRIMSQWGIWDERMSARIIPLPGDLSMPLLGLSPDTFASLAETIDVIYHNGASVNFAYPYSALKAANVGGTQEIIRLAAQGRVKPVHYVSTLAILSTFGFFGVRTVNEDAPLEHPDRLFMGYIETKWVSEKVLMLASQRGLPVSLYRPKDVTGDTRTGAWKTEGFLLSFLKSSVDLGCAPDVRFSLDFVPVDYLAKALVHISMNEFPTGKAYHFSNRPLRPSGAFFERLQALGYPVKMLPYQEWVQRLVEHSARNPTSHLTPFIPLFTERWSEAQISVMEIYLSDRLPEFGCHNTEKALSGSGITCPPVTDELLALYISYFQKTGFFPLPPKPA